MAYKLVDQLANPQAISVIDTTKNIALGTEADAFDPDLGEAKVVYVEFKASQAVPVGTILQQEIITGSLHPYRMLILPSTTPATAAAGMPLFVNLTAVGSNAALQYGWVLVQGQVNVLKTNVSIAGTEALYISGTAGRLYKTTTSAARQIVGARVGKSSVTTTTSLVPVYWNRATTHAL